MKVENIKTRCKFLNSKFNLKWRWKCLQRKKMEFMEIIYKIIILSKLLWIAKWNEIHMNWRCWWIKSNLFVTVQEKRLTGLPAKIMSKNVWSRKMCITFKRTEAPDCFVLHFIQMEVGNRKIYYGLFASKNLFNDLYICILRL